MTLLFNYPGSFRNHNQPLFNVLAATRRIFQWRLIMSIRFRPLLNKFGNEPRLSMILFTLDETSYSRELAPLAGLSHPKTGPLGGSTTVRKGCYFRRQTNETTGFYNTVGFNDDTRLSCQSLLGTI